MGPLEIMIGNHYEVQPESFQRVFIGEAKEINEEGILFEILSYDSCDEEQVSKENPFIVVNQMDVKTEVGGDIFFS